MAVDPRSTALSDSWAQPLENGFHVLPLKRDAKTPAGRWMQFRNRRPTIAELKSWQEKRFNVGIVTGASSSLLVLDLDNAAALAEAEARGLPNTPRVSTPRGQHVYFKHPGYRVPNSTSLFEGADLRGDGGYVVGPGSVFVPSPAEATNGKLAGEYLWLVAPSDAPLAPPPDWLLRSLRHSDVSDISVPSAVHSAQAGDGEIRRLIQAVRTAAVGTRNDTLNRVSFDIAKQCACDPSIDGDDFKVDLAQAGIDAGLAMKEINATIESGWSAGIKDAKIDPTEDGVALHFSRTVGLDFLYDNNRSHWFRWNGTTWQPVPTNDVNGEIRRIGRSVCKAALRKGAAVSGAERLARCDLAHRPAASWDRDPLLLGTPAGVVDLRSGQLRSSDKQDLITKQVAVLPKVGNAKLWEAFLSDATGEDHELIAFLQRMCGYLLTGDIREQCLFFVYGQGGNGKSVFLNTICAILKDYAVTAPAESFTASRYDRHPTELAMLAGARLVSAAETEHGKPWAEARVKQLTGGDSISTRFMRCDFFTFIPTFKLVIIGNHKPDVRDVDDALRRRILIIPFTRRPARPDLLLEQKLRQEYPQILAWMIKGTKQWLSAGLGPPRAVLAATADYFAEQDVVARWIEDRCETNRVARATPSELHASWARYAHEMGHPLLTMKALGEALERHGFVSVKSNGTRYRCGLSVSADQFDNLGSQGSGV